MRRTGVVLGLAVMFASATSAEAAIHARGSVEQVLVTGAEPGKRLTLFDRSGRRVASQRVGKLGGVIFRDIAPGRGYRIGKRHVRVLPNRSKPPSRRLYGQKIPTSGYGYLTTRDGTRLAINVRLPSGPGPYPTLVEYAGYAYADPAGPQSSIAPIANALGFAVVDVNMRGTGCSGGAYDFFDPVQNLDGYDVIETVARQPWAMRHKVGMVGLSFGGISQLFVAATRPPSLSAITPLSVIDTTQTTLYPGGIINTGFALSWWKDRIHDAKPASTTGGQPWALDRIKVGDKTCRRNQALHAETIDLLGRIEDNRFYIPREADPVAPVTFVKKIEVPVFLACQWTDEQTGGHCPTLARRFTGTSRKWFTFTNGTHVDSLDPETFNRWYDFMKIYVARQAPKIPDGIKAAAPVVYQAIMGVDGVTLPDDPIQSQPNLAAAQAAFEAQPSVRILFDSGAGRQPGQPYPGFERSFARWPAATARSWYLNAGGTLTDAAPAARGDDTFTWRLGPATDFTGDTGSGDLWTATPSYRWTPHAAGTALSYTSAPLTANTVVVGTGALYTWVKSSSRDIDLQATVTEVRPDGKETFVQSGWVRGSLRKLDRRKSTLLQPVLSLRRRDAKRMPKGRFARVVVPLYYQGHAYRAGSRLRVTISAPGGDQPVWAFKGTRPGRDAAVTIRRSKTSRLVLPVVPGVTVPTGLPPCPGLRGEPCR